MSLPRSAVMQRGASVLAALVIAAALASIALVVQQGSPVAYTQSQTAAAAAPPGGVSVSCDPLYDYQVDLSDPKNPKETRVNVCAPPADAGDMLQRKDLKCNSDSAGMQTPPSGSASKAQVCEMVAGKKQCKPYECQKGDPVMKGAAQAAGSLTAQAVADGTLPPDEAAKLKNSLGLDSGAQSAFDAGYQSGIDEAKADAQDKADKSDQADQAAQKLQAFADQQCGGGVVTTGMCAGVSESLDKAEKASNAANEAAAEAQVKLDNLTEAQSALKSSDGGTPPDIAACDSGTAPNDGEGCPDKIDNYCASSAGKADTKICGNSTPGAGQPCPQGQIGTYPSCRTPTNTFTPGPTGPGGDRSSAACQACNSGNQNSCMQCAKDQGNTGGMPGAGQGGQKSGGGGSGSGQQQQQCQPQYQCTTSGTASTVMYNQCPQQNSQWQTYQQCPTNYTCQNNGCVAAAPYGYCTNGQPRTAPAQSQPAASGCTVGTWQDSSNGCQQSWVCSAGTTAAGTPTAQLSCQPLIAASGTIITFAYVCANGATAAAATNFTIPSANTLSGTATTSAQKPADGTSSVTYGLTCTNASVAPALTASAQCAVQIGNAAIVLVATPEKIAKTETDTLKRESTIGWVTSGMQSCVISDTDFPDWTTAQAGNTSVSGSAVSPIITADTTFKLTCQTASGTVASSTVKVLSI